MNTSRRYNLRIAATIIILTFALISVGMGPSFTNQPVSIFYVDDNACPAVGSGTELDPYCKIQTAVDNATSGNEIRVAEGVYTGVEKATDTQGYEYWQVVYVDKALTLKGGYDDDNWNAAPDPKEHKTIINAERLGRSITVVGTQADAVIVDGFTITGGDYTGKGNPDGVSGQRCSRTGHDCGGGLFAKGVEMDLLNSYIYDNYSNTEDSGRSGDGGGVYYWAVKSGSTIQHTTVISNTVSGAVGDGGGVKIAHGESVIISNSKILDNYAGDEGGGLKIFQPEDKITITETDFYNNEAGDIGGAMKMNSAMEGEALVMDRVRMSNNVSSDDGTSLYLDQQGNYSTSAILTNLVFDSSHSSISNTNASVVYVQNTSSFDVTMNHITASNNLSDTFLVANTDDDEGDAMTFDIANILLQSFTNGYVGKERGSAVLIINHTNTLFDDVTNQEVSAVGSPTFNPTGAITGNAGLIGSYLLTLASDAIDAGVDAGVLHDYDGDPRNDGHPDIGADEYYPRLYLPLLLNMGN
ncbi:MAG: hypothetical protein U9R58_11930 [Chloroflexota bacterium]|nr:hypothetical protein [Chloroflexota bacterium]